MINHNLIIIIGFFIKLLEKRMPLFMIKLIILRHPLPFIKCIFVLHSLIQFILQIWVYFITNSKIENTKASIAANKEPLATSLFFFQF